MNTNSYWLKAFLVVGVILSLTLIGWGAHKGNSLDIYLMLVTIGSAFFGVFSGMILNNVITSKKADYVLQTVENNILDVKRAILKEDLLTSAKDDLNDILGQWHQYNVTKKSGKYYWVHVVYDIKSNLLNEISFDVEYRNNKGGLSYYKYSGFIRDERVIFVGKPKGAKQPCFIEVWPHLGSHVSEYHCGLCFNQSWDRDETLIPCILSRKPLTNKNNIDNLKLDELWKSGTDIINLSIFPRINLQN